MIRQFVLTISFEKAWRDMGLGENDLRRLERMLLDDPAVGTVIEGSGGARKVQLAVDGKGKSGGARVIYVDIVARESIFLLYAYPKSAKDNLSDKELSAMKKAVAMLKSNG